jgi:hypothetical protein
MIPFVAAIGLIWLGIATRADPSARSWVFIALGLIMAADEALEQVQKHLGRGDRFTPVRRALAIVFVALIVVSVVL